MIAVLVMTPASRAEPKPPTDGKKDDPPKETEPAVDDRYRRDAEKVVGGIEMEVFKEDAWTKVKRIEKPLLFYDDPTRDNDRGSVWGWGEKGRPVALIELWQHVEDRTSWYFCLCNTSGGRVRASRGGAAWWRENESAAELKDVPNAPAPVADSAQRLRQAKQLSLKFRGHEFWDPNNTRYDLRRLDRPLHTYKDEDAGLLDGALYSPANGTNPEIMVFIEAHRDPKDATRSVWRFAVGRSAHAELHLEYEGKEVYEAPRGNKVAGSNKPYWLSYMDIPDEIKPEK
jgi:hypothetical protein